MKLRLLIGDNIPDFRMPIFKAQFPLRRDFPETSPSGEVSGKSRRNGIWAVDFWWPDPLCPPCVRNLATLLSVTLEVGGNLFRADVCIVDRFRASAGHSTVHAAATLTTADSPQY